MNEIFVQDADKKKIAYITFPKVSEDTYCIEHTVVDESIQGQGVAKELVHRAIAYIHNKKGKVSATCSYAIKYMQDNGIEE